MRVRFAPLAAVVIVSLLAAAAQAQQGNYQVDPVHSSVVFKNHHLGAGHVWGRFNNVSGSFTLGDNAADAKFELTIQADSIDTGNPARDKHLKNPDFFDAQQFPTITFKSTKVSEGKDDTLEVVGDLTLHGVTKPITVIVKKTGVGKGPKGEERTGVDASFTVKRSEYGMDKMIPAAGDEVMLFVSLEGIKGE